MVEDLTVRDVMTHDFLGVSESDSVAEVAQLMVEEGASAVAIIRGSEPIGVVMAGRMIDALLQTETPEHVSIDAIMHRPPRSIRPDLSLAEAAAILADADTDHVFVTTGDEILGVLSENDLITAVTSMLTTESDTPLDDDYDAAVGSESEGLGTMSSQSVCEVCGTLKTNLENINGQLVCDDCRAV